MVYSGLQGRLNVGVWLVAAALLLTGCSSISAGNVTEKSFIPAHEEYAGQICYSYNAQGICTVSMPNYVFVGDCYKIVISDGDDRAGYCLSEEQYNDTSIGEWVDYGE